MLNVGISGAGRGLRFVRFFRQLGTARCAGIADPSAEARQKVASLYPDVETFETYEQLIDAQPDAVIVASPPSFHVEQAVLALDRGIAVLSEVPAVIDVQEASTLVEAAQRSSALYMLGENYCFLPGVQTLNNMIKAGLFGELYFAEGQYVHCAVQGGPPSSKWRLDLIASRSATYITHALGPILQWIGEPLSAISCIGAGRDDSLPFEHDATYALTGRTKSRNIVRIRQDLISRRPRSTTWFGLQGEHGVYEGSWDEWRDGRVCLSTLDPQDEWVPLLSFAAEYLPPDFIGEELPTNRVTGDVLMLRRFIEAVTNGMPSPINVYDALDISLPGIVSRDSVVKGGEWIDVPSFHPS